MKIPEKKRGRRSAVSTENWEKALWEYRILDDTSPVVAERLGLAPTTVRRRFDAMLDAEPNILRRLVKKYGDGSAEVKAS